MTSAAWSLALIVAFLALLWMMQRRLVYFPTSDVPAPEDLGLIGVESVAFEASDGTELAGWFLGAPGRQPRPAVLVFNGNAGNRSHRTPLAAAFQRTGFHVLLVDYRGYGGNPGQPTERGLALDGRAARSYLAGRSDVDPSRLVYFGESLGSAVAVDLAAEHTPAALILRSPFTSLADIGQHHYPFLPVRLLLRDRFAAIDRIRRVRAPLLVIAGQRDRIVPLAYSQRLYEAAESAKTLLVLPDADHNDDEMLAGDDMVRAMIQFLRPLVDAESDTSR